MLRFSEDEYEAFQRRRALTVPEREMAVIPPAEPLTLPWPPRELSPNARVHWAKRSPIAKQYRETCARLCRAAGLVAPDTDLIRLVMTFYPPDRRARDDDNLIGSMKAARDGIADALGVDDKRFRGEYHFAGTGKGGAVVIELRRIEA